MTHLLCSPTQDWRSGAGYEALKGADISAFAWEWTRRNADYREAWRNFVAARQAPPPDPRTFGLVEFEDPARPVPVARPVWRCDALTDALTAHVLTAGGPQRDRVDLRHLASLVTIILGSGDIEHLLLSDGRHFLRIDVISGTLIGCPAPLTYMLSGLTHLQGPVDALRRLAWLAREGHFREEAGAGKNHQHRRILELRVADALAAGADQQGIARALFGPLIADRRWRLESACYRRRIQRLVANARLLLRHPPHPGSAWCSSPIGAP